jgi:hypothetical protein
MQGSVFLLEIVKKSKRKAWALPKPTRGGGPWTRKFWAE